MDDAGSETELGASNNGAQDLSPADNSLIDSSLWGADGGLGERGAGGVYPEEDSQNGQGDQNYIDSKPEGSR